MLNGFESVVELPNINFQIHELFQTITPTHDYLFLNFYMRYK